jgi:UDP-GlcNAc:undecaprenyl-phosphate GlcNAc-1-phosphate transferase
MIESSVINNYLNILPYFLASLVLALLLTPWMGRLAQRIGAIDLPARMRRAGEESHRINSKITPRLGGLAIVAAIGIVLLFSQSIGLSSLSSNLGFNSWGIWLGVLILTVAGIWDDVRDMPAWMQFIVQFAAAICVVASGVKLDSISVGRDILDSFGNVQFSFLVERVWQFPADLIVIFWIVAIMNFVNWASGVDALHGSLTSVSLGALILIAMQNGNPILATLIAVHLGAVLGVLPYNYYPSKIFYGLGESVNGFLIAVFAISGDVKIASSLIILGLPLIDALWVATNRVTRKMQETNNPIAWLAATMKSDKTHLHHRLLELGFSWKTVTFIELGIMSVFAILAFLLSGFDPVGLTLQLSIAFGILIAILIFISIYQKRRKDTVLHLKAMGVTEATVEVKLKSQLEKHDDDTEQFIY